MYSVLQSFVSNAFSLRVTRVVVLACFLVRLSITTGEADSSKLVGVGARSSNRRRIEHWGSAAFPNCPSAVFYIKLKPDFS